jgi:hypothetical protein
MGKISKKSALFLTLTIVLSCLTILTVKPADAQSIPKPTVPEFTLKYIDRSFVEPVAYSTATDPFTGKQVTTSSGGSYIEKKTVDVTIKNQNYPNTDSGQLYYTVQTKGHFANWTTDPVDGYSFKRILASNSSYTVVTLTISPYADAVPSYQDVFIPDGGMEDFQVNAEVGYYYQVASDHFPPYYIQKFQTVEQSGWSNTLTICIPDGSVLTLPDPIDIPNHPATNTPAPTPTVTQTPTTSPTENPPAESEIALSPTTLAVIIVTVALVASAVSILAYRKYAKRAPNG